MAFHRIERLGAGHSGELWLEHDDELQRDCAARYLKPDRVAPGLDPLAEVQQLLLAEHDHVVTVYSAALEHGVAVIRMEYLPAGSVADHYGSGPLPVATAMAVTIDAARGVEHLHSRGLLHRDLKPANLLLGPTGQVKVSDFGLACSQFSPGDGPPMGYQLHLPPEALAGSGVIETVAGDIYALGITLYRLLEGDAALASPAAGPERDALVAEGLFPDRTALSPHVHGSLRRALAKALHVDPAERFGSASDLRHALEKAHPVVAWTPASEGNAWSGSAGDGSVNWRARLVSRAGGFDFQVERQKDGGSFRKDTAAGARARNLEEGLTFARKALEKIATGR